jgi:nucleotide-binding universal stress UspA family protein
MATQTSSTPIPIRHIFHPSDFSQGDYPALIHALRLALSGGARLSLLHVASHEDDVTFDEFPRVRPILAKWSSVPKEDVNGNRPHSGLFIEKVRKVGSPVECILKHLRKHPADLVVLATHQREGPSRWIHQTFAEPIARRARNMTLFVPRAHKGFVSAETGKSKVRRILIPCHKNPSPQRAVDVACSLVDILGVTDVTISLLHVGNPGDAPMVRIPQGSAYKFESISSQGNVVSQILNVSRKISADLIVMTTKGHKGFLHAIRGTTTERILRNADCPTLMIPS